MFWGLIMEPQRRYSQSVKRAFHISMAALDESTSDKNPTQVICSFDDRNYLLCTLEKGKTSQVTLDLNYEVGDQISFATNGKAHVHLTGYLLEEQFPLEEGEEEEEDNEETEQNEGGKSKKRQRNASNSPQKKKFKTLELLEALDSNDSDDSDDSDVNTTDLVEDDDDDIDMTALEEAESEEDDTKEEEDDDAEDEEDEDDVVEGQDSDENSSSLSEDEEVQVVKKVMENGVASKKEKKQKQAQQQTPTNAQKQQQQQKKDKAAKGEKTPAKGDKTPKVKGAQTPAKGEKTPTKGDKTPAKSPKQSPEKVSPQKRTIEGGVVIEEIKVGNGAAAKPGKFVKVYYEGRLKHNNKMFDSTSKGAGFEFRLGRQEVIKGWDVGLAGMKVGGKRRIVCPPNMAYGQKGSPPTIPPNTTLVFEVELKHVK